MKIYFYESSLKIWQIKKHVNILFLEMCKLYILIKVEEWNKHWCDDKKYKK